MLPVIFIILKCGQYLVKVEEIQKCRSKFLKLSTKDDNNVIPNQIKQLMKGAKIKKHNSRMSKLNMSCLD